MRLFIAAAVAHARLIDSGKFSGARRFCLFSGFLRQDYYDISSSRVLKLRTLFRPNDYYSILVGVDRVLWGNMRSRKDRSVAAALRRFKP